MNVFEASDRENAVEAVFHASGEVLHQALQEGVGLQVGEGSNILDSAGQILRGAGAAAADLEDIHTLESDHVFTLEEVGEVVGEVEALLEGGDLVLGKCHVEKGKPAPMPRQVESRFSANAGLKGL